MTTKKKTLSQQIAQRQYTIAQRLLGVSFLLYALSVGTFIYLLVQLYPLVNPDEPASDALINYPVILIVSIATTLATLSMIMAWTAITQSRHHHIITYFTLTIIAWLLVVASSFIIYRVHFENIVAPISILTGNG